MPVSAVEKGGVARIAMVRALRAGNLKPVPIPEKAKKYRIVS